MGSTAPLFAFRRFRSRLLVFLLALLVPVLGGIFYFVNSNNTAYTEETINSYLELSASVFDDTRDQQAATLQAIINSLAFDFGFRTAFAADDPATLFDAALNVLERSLGSVDMLMIVGLDGAVIIDTELQGYELLEGHWQAMVERADRDEEGRADAVLPINDQPFQLITLPLYLPRQVAWIIGGFALDQAFVDQVKETTLSDFSILSLVDGSELALIASTLGEPRRAQLVRQLDLGRVEAGELQRIDFGDEEFTTLLRRLYGGSGESLQILAAVQRSYDENNANVVRSRQLLIQFYALVLVLSLVAVVLLARSITNPVTRLAQLVRRIETGDYSTRVEVRSRDEFGTLSSSVNAMAAGLAEKEKVRDLLGKVVSHQIAEELLSNPVELGGEERVITVLFSDIRGFTSFCEGLPPQQVLEALNRVLSRVSDIVEAHHGVVDKYQGDAVMALFGAPILSDNDAPNAMAAALEIVAVLEEMESELSACVGVNTGLVVAGNLGSQNRLNYSVIGDTVNLAARLESLTRLYHVATIVSEASRAAAPGYLYRELDEVRVAGKQNSVRIFEVVGEAGRVGAEKSTLLAGFDKALALYRNQQWEVAAAAFAAQRSAGDNPALCQVYLDRIAQFKDNPPAADWRGIHVFDKK